jgi:hypothetical protein
VGVFVSSGREETLKLDHQPDDLMSRLNGSNSPTYFNSTTGKEDR